MTIPNPDFMIQNGVCDFPSSPEEEKRIVSELTNESEDNLKEGNLYFVISKRWYTSWQKYVEQSSNECSSGEPAEDPKPGPIDNNDIIESESGTNDPQLRRLLVEGEDYVLVPQEVWKTLVEWYSGGPPIPRKLICQGFYSRSYSVEVYPLCLMLTDGRDESRTAIRLGKQASIKELYGKVCAMTGVAQEKAHIWDYFDKRKNRLLDPSSNKSLEESSLHMDQDILLEVNGSSSSQYAMSSAGNELALVPLEPSRSRVTIAGGPTLSNGHSTTSKFSLFPRITSEDDGCDSLSTLEKGEKGGLAGLSNLGNTCFMNSALQCLAHTPPIVEYFLQDYSDDINRDNPLGMCGELAIAFGDLLKKLWSSGRNPVAPRSFKTKLARFAPQFSGYNQHDSQELLAFLLDGLHEDLNKVKRKPYIELKDSDSRPDNEVAEELWNYHKARNDSVIVNVCQGQYKSTLVCPVCGKISITFDPFMYLSLPLPSTLTRPMTVTVFYCDGSHLPMPYTVTVPKHGSCRDLITALGTACCLADDESLLLAERNFVARAKAERKVHIVYLGEKQHDDPEVVTGSHHQILWSLLGSKEDAHDSMVYSYRHGFSGFAAKLTKSQAKKISDLPDVVHVIPDSFYKLTTTRTWDYLGLSAANPKNLLNETNMGDQMIIGIIDTGVWPESEVFNDNGFEPVPSHWKGGCESGENFTSSHCNKKLIGAKYFINAFLAENESFNSTKSLDFISPRDLDGHGTHVSTIAGGSYVPNISYKGLAGGTVRGGAPRARIAMYKACWYLDDEDITTCSSADILKAIDEAIHDGVDVLSLSLGSDVPMYGETDIRDGITTGAFHAVLKGITVVCAGGNSGPEALTVTNTAPWIITVAATTLDRSFATPITLGNNKMIMGQAMYTGPEIGFTNLVYPENPGNSNGSFSGTCEELSENYNHILAGKVVLCFTTLPYSASASSAASSVKTAGGLGVIIARHPGYAIRPCLDDFPCVAVDWELGTDILLYIRSSGSPVVKIQRSKTLIGQPVGTKVATFSSRGPNSIAAAILKPDIAAPGVSILAATTTNTTFNDRGFIMLSGTSMAAPVISGVVALLKALHRDWSPAAIRSAIVTTAWRTDPFGEQIFAEGSPRKLADPFDYGGGLVNPEKAAKPGLVYDLGLEDYVLYMCSVGYNESSISQLVGKGTVCSNPKPSVLDFNLPSITIPNLKDEVTLTRTVTNVGPLKSVYRLTVEPPLGFQVTVTPKTLVFNSRTKRVSFKVRVSTTHKINTGFYFGSLTWSDSVHNVTIPMSVRTQIMQNYFDEN